MSCGVGRRGGYDLALLWLWCRPAALIRPLAWDPPYAVSVALKRQKDNNNNKKEREKENPVKNSVLLLLRHFFFKITLLSGALILISSQSRIRKLEKSVMFIF